MTRGRPAGATVRLTMDEMEDVQEGDYLLSAAGSAYLVLSASPGRRPRRWILRCLKLSGPEAIPAPPDAEVFEFIWNPRRKRAA